MRGQAFGPAFAAGVTSKPGRPVAAVRRRRQARPDPPRRSREPSAKKGGQACSVSTLAQCVILSAAKDPGPGKGAGVPTRSLRPRFLAALGMTLVRQLETDQA